MPTLRLGIIGGIDKSSFGYLHLCAAKSDNLYEITCGVFSRNHAKSQAIGKTIGIEADKVYKDYKEMLLAESKLPADERIQVVTIVTPNNYHFEIAKLAFELGFHVVLEKPISFTLEEGQKLEKLAADNNVLCCVNFTNIGFPLVKEAQSIVSKGTLGKIRKVNVSFCQEWLNQHNIDSATQTSTIWRTDPAQSGLSCTIADIGSHAFNLAEYVTQLKVTAICAELNTYVSGKTLDDDGMILLKFDNGATGMLYASQIIVGERAGLKIHIAGEDGSLIWELEQPNQLQLMLANQPKITLRAGIDNQLFNERTNQNGRTPAGQDEGVIGAIANHYRNLYQAIQDKKPSHYPTLREGVRSMGFIETTIASSNSEEKWTTFKI